MSSTQATRTAPEEVLQIIIDLHAAVDARIKVCPVLVLAATFIFRTLGSLRDGLAALVGRIPGGPSPRRRKRRPPAPPPQTAANANTTNTHATDTSATDTSATAASVSPTTESSASAGPASESAASPTAGNASADSASTGAKAPPRKPRRWPSKYRAIADLIGDDAAAFAARLRAILADPDARAYMRANPAFADYLRPICRGFRVRLIPELRRKPAFRFEAEFEPFEETPPVEPETPSPIESIAEPAPVPAPEPPPATPQPSPVPPPQPPMYGIGPPDWTPTDPGPSMKERVDRWLAKQRALGLI